MKEEYFPTTILSSNTKTGCSLNHPIAGHCRPTPVCSRTCYARSGHTALPSSKRKQLWLSQYLTGSNISKLIEECRSRIAVRLSGTGDLNREHLPNVLKLARACPQTIFWGMTRKLEIARALNRKLPNLKLMVSVDSSTPESVWKSVYKTDVLCWGPRLASDRSLGRLESQIRTVFPYHKTGRIVAEKQMPNDPKDCPAVRHRVKGCMSCTQCWTW